MKKNKILTFSYDDGVSQDIRLIGMLDKYGLKCTFNLNSGLLGNQNELVREGVTISHNKVSPKDVRAIYQGHEIAAHTVHHPFLPSFEQDADIIREVEEDRLRLSELAGYEVVGFAYPGGGVNFNRHIADVIMQSTGIKYCRTTVSSHSFDVQEDLSVFKPSVYHHREWDKLFELGEKFVDLKTDKKQIFYVWGHSYEFDIHNTWDRFEEFCRLIAFKDDIAYLTNKEALLD